MRRILDFAGLEPAKAWRLFERLDRVLQSRLGAAMNPRQQALLKTEVGPVANAYGYGLDVSAPMAGLQPSSLSSSRG